MGPTLRFHIVGTLTPLHSHPKQYKFLLPQFRKPKILFHHSCTNHYLLPSSSSMAMNDKNIERVSEESGWTAYLQDFSCNNSFLSSSSLVSDAAWNGHDSIARLNLNKLRRSNKSRKHMCEHDDDLEDTASSPVNSPKVSTMKQMEVNHGRIDDVASCDFLGQQSSSNNLLKNNREERNTKNLIEDKNIDQYMELRKRGLCLVPMSALMNYIG